MKKITTLLFAGVVAIASVQLSSCKKKDNSSATLVGTWMATNGSDKVWIDGTLTEDSSFTYKTDSALMVFNSDNTFTTKTNGVVEETGTYKTEGTKLIMIGTQSSDTADYTLTTNSLKLNYNSTEDFFGSTLKYEAVINCVKK